MADDTAFGRFARLGAWPPASPVVVSVPHAGRDYPPVMLARLRVATPVLRALEDRRIDAVAAPLADLATIFVAQAPRVWIDLNRGEEERDPLLETGLDRTRVGQPSAKVRSGLGLVPRRLGRTGDLWRERLPAAEIDRRIAMHHRPYHAALAEALAAARRRFGTAILLDLHSMPPLAGSDAAQIVIGDRFGKSAHARFVAAVEAQVRTEGLRVALNSPYAGGHILARHGDPGSAIHAIQLEVDRTLYLDAALDDVGDGLARTITLVRQIVLALADEAEPRAIAAE